VAKVRHACAFLRGTRQTIGGGRTRGTVTAGSNGSGSSTRWQGAALVEEED